MKPLVIVLLLGFVQPGPGAVLPVYRDFLKPRPFVHAGLDDRCGVGTGPLQILKTETPKSEVVAIVSALDAANVQILAERSLALAARRLPGPAVTICLFPGELTGGLPYLGGVGGVSLGGGRINLLLHPRPGGLRRVAYTVAHEYHHEVERSVGPGGGTPIDIMIREGKADHFATALYPELRPPHTNPLSDAEFRSAWSDFAEFDERNASPAEFRTRFMIGRDPRVLMWPGYRLGYEIVQLYFGGTALAPSDAIKVPARTIFEHYRRNGRPSRLP